MKHSREALLGLAYDQGSGLRSVCHAALSSASTALDRGISIKNRNGGGYVLLAQFEQYANCYIIALLDNEGVRENQTRAAKDEHHSCTKSNKIISHSIDMKLVNSNV